MVPIGKVIEILPFCFCEQVWSDEKWSVEHLSKSPELIFKLKNRSNFIQHLKPEHFMLIAIKEKDDKDTKAHILSLERIYEKDSGPKLLEMAEKANISATSFTVQAYNSPPKCLSVSYREGLDKKLFIPVYISNYRVIACLDSGSDLTIMQIGLYKSIFKNKKLSKCAIPHIKSFSNNSIKVLGQVTCTVKFNTRNNLTATLTIVVINNINDQVPSFLFGNDSFKTCLATLGYTGSRDNPEPEFMLNLQETPLRVPVYQATPADTMTCRGEYNISSFGTQNIEMYLHPAAPVVRNAEIIITSQLFEDVQILPSKSDIEFIEKLDCYKATACIVNLTHLTKSGIISGRFEILHKSSQYSSYTINAEQKDKLLKLMLEKPPVREVLESSDSSFNICVPVPCIARVDLQLEDDVDPHLRDKNPKFEDETEILKDDILLGNSVSYTGEAEISDKIIETGLEIPTMIYNTPEEALNLNLFEPIIRPYIKKIFLDKYPQVVSLHSLDAGDVSKTLGYTTLRLNPGENLPRHKRIYQLSPQDANYLELLLEQFIRFNYVRRAPIDSTDLHLYGMSTYLVPRKKLTDIARLVIDFSPLTSIIQSPPSVVPDISASLQRLQGKGIFSAMD